jgi:hypothetical protein
MSRRNIPSTGITLKIFRSVYGYWIRRIFWIALLFLVPVFSSYSQDQTCGIQWGSRYQISNDSVLSIKPLVALTGDTIHILWYGVDTLGTIYQDGVQYSHSFNGGMTFTTEQTLLPMENAFTPGLLAVSGSFIYVATLAAVDTFYGTVLLRSSDAGNTWQPLQYLLKNTEPQGIVAQDSVVFLHYGNFSHTAYGFIVSTDHGATWHPRMTGIPHLSSMIIVGNQLDAVGEVDGNIGTEVGYFSTTLDGSSLYGPDIISSDDNIPSLMPEITVNEYGDLFITWTETGKIFLRRSRNSGISWLTPIVLSTRKNAVFSDVAADSEFVGAVWDNDFGSGGAIYIRTSNDFGATFCPIDSPTSGTQVGEPALVIANKKIHLVWSEESSGNSEIYYRDGTLTDNPNLVITPPKEFSLLQNYPNPFNGSTHLRYDIPRTTPVTLTIFNVLGQQVAKLVDAIQSPAHYDIPFDGTNLATGVYFYRLRTDAFTAIKKLMIIR